ncbi:allophanate hydrolase subunit 1 [Nocardioides sp. DS6]|uniref:Allophanate hydrolase subunit 1 n=1 Tax=Nocardioides eburneus TaxID=3231482 RepID=A0ABV3T4F4_9ACTN
MAGPTVRACGPRALLVEVDSAEGAAMLARWARTAGLAAGDVVPAACTVLFDDVDDPERLRTRLADWSPSSEVPAGPLVELPTSYDGPDLGFVAAHWGVDEAEVVARHTGLEFVSAFCGFAPGFAYLTGLPEEWAVPRLASPRARVPAGSVGLAGGYCGVYPTASPGGWRLLGRTDAPLWDLARDEPALLAPGTRVRFVAAA